MHILKFTIEVKSDFCQDRGNGEEVWFKRQRNIVFVK